MANSYDYIVVGVGTAGAVLVNMLSRKYSVLGIESGRNYDSNSDILNSAEASLLDTNFLWKFFWQGETTFDQTTQQSYHWAGGRLLGGCSSINGEQYVKGTASLYDKWAQLGGYVWSSANVFNNYRELENYHGITDPSHGICGPLNISQVPNTPTVFNSKVAQALSASSGISLITDYNIPTQETGVFERWQLTQYQNGVRVSSSNTFLGPSVMSFDECKGTAHGCGCYDFKIQFNSTANKLIWDCNKVVGIEYVKNGRTKCAYACKGVIMCSGIRTPEILQRSGIGPSFQLERLNIKPRINLPVGSNIVNQILSTAVFSKDPNDPTLVNPNDIYAGGAFLPDPTDLSGPRKYQLVVSGIDDNTFSLSIIILDPKSRGYSMIQDADPYTIPMVVSNYLSNSDDLQSFIVAYQTYVLQLNNYFLANPGQYTGYQLISPSLAVISDINALTDYIKTNIVQTYNISSTARMGDVVDGCGRVYNTKNLYIADNCIAPYINNGNTQSTAYLIGYTIAKQLLC